MKNQLRIWTAAVMAVVLTAGVASAYDYGWDPAKDQGKDFYCELAQDPTFIVSGEYAGKFEYFFDFYIVGVAETESTTYALGITGLDNSKIANAQTINPDAEVFKTQEWGDPNGYENRDEWADSPGRLLDFWTKDANASLASATATNWWRTSYDNGVGGWTDTGLGYAGSSTANPHSYDEYVEWSSYDYDFYMADLAGADPVGPAPWEVTGGYDNLPAEDMIAIVPGHMYWAPTDSQGLVATVRVVYDGPIDPLTIGWAKGMGKEFPVLGDFTLNLPPPGDFDGDYDIDDLDIDALCDFIRTSMPYDVDYDLSADGTTEGTDGVVDLKDLDYLVHYLVDTAVGNGTEYGDFNLDGKLDTTDLTRIATNYGPNDWKWADGNANRNIDTNIDNTDLTILATYYGFGAPDVVPEPASAALMLLAGAAVLKRRRRA